MIITSALPVIATAEEMRAHSGLQKQVLALYKRALQAAKAKDREALAAADSSQGAATSGNETYAFVRERFRDDVRVLNSVNALSAKRV